MGIVRADVVMPYITGTPEDVVMNTYHFNVPIVGEDAFIAIFSALQNVYNTVPTGATASIGSQLSAYIDRTADSCQILAYDAQNEGPPLAGGLWDLDSTAQLSSLPFEVALCGSYSAYQLGVDRRRSRGRIYFGPFNSNALTDPDDQPSVPTTSLMNSVSGALADLRDSGTLATAEVEWVVYSRMNDAAYPVTAGWVDNAWDTQRRRQVEASTRINW